MTTKINTVPVADPFDYQANLEILGASQRSANGTWLIDYFSTTPKYKVTLQWRLLTLAERNSIITQCTNAITASRALEIPDGRIFTVFLDLGANITETMLRDAGGYKYNLTVSFVEE